MNKIMPVIESLWCIFKTIICFVVSISGSYELINGDKTVGLLMVIVGIIMMEIKVL